MFINLILLMQAELVVPGLVDIETEAEPLSILLVITSHKLYFLKITGATRLILKIYFNFNFQYQQYLSLQ